MPEFNRQLQQENRRNSLLYAWTRPTIEWDLTCESDPTRTRDVVMWTFSHPFSMPTRVKVALGFAYTVLAIELICCGCAGVFAISQRQNEPFTIARGCATACGCLFIFNVVWMLSTAVGMQSSNVDTLTNYSVINGCSDQYTHVPVEDMTTSIEQSSGYLQYASYM